MIGKGTRSRHFEDFKRKEVTIGYASGNYITIPHSNPLALRLLCEVLSDQQIEKVKWVNHEDYFFIRILNRDRTFYQELKEYILLNQ